MKVILSIIGLALLATIAGCVALPTEEELTALNSTTPICIDDKDCKAKWDAAQLWVVKYSSFKLQMVTDVSIETYSPPEYSDWLAYRVTKEPLGGGKYKIVVTAYCGLNGGCEFSSVRPIDMELAFNKAVGAASP